MCGKLAQALVTYMGDPHLRYYTLSLNWVFSASCGHFKNELADEISLFDLQIGLLNKLVKIEAF